MSREPSRVLIVRLGSMGDIVHALPVLASLRAQWPAVEVDWLVDRRHCALLDLVPGTSPIVVDTREVIGQAGWIAVLRRLQARRYDLVIDAQGLIKSALLARGARAPVVIGFARGAAREEAAAWLYTRTVDPAPAHHVIDWNLALARAAGVKDPVRAFPLDVPAPGAAVEQCLAGIGTPFVVLNPGAAWPNKRWPADRFGVLAARLRASQGAPSLVLWGPGERDLADAVVAAAEGAAALAPGTTLNDLVAILSRASLVVAGDTGPLHLAVALGTPAVGIYGPTNPLRNGPWAPSDQWVSRHDRCECYHKRQCRAKRWCLEDLGVPDVEAAATQRLAAAGREAGARR